jgi:ankyrin repeat protein
MSKAFWLCIFVAVFLFGCGQSKDQAVQELAKLNVKFTPDDFVRSAEKGDTKAVQLFLAAGMDPNVQNAAGVTALMAASKNGRIEVVNKLLTQKVNVDAQDKQGVTALMLAAENNQLETVKLLLKKNADPNTEDQSGWSALMKAVFQGNTGCVETLAARSRQEVNRGLLIAALTGHREIAKVLLDDGAEVDSRADDGRTPLMLAASKGDIDLVSLLLQAGADPAITDKSGATAGALAIAKGYQNVAGRLQQAQPAAVASSQNASGGRSPVEPSGVMPDKDVMAQSQRDKGAGSLESGRAGKSADAPAGSTPPKPASVVEIQQEFLPVTLTEVSGKRAKIRPVDGEEYSVVIGDQLKGLDYKVTDVEAHNTEDKDGNPVDESVVKLKNTKSGQAIALIKGVPAQEHAAYAILAFPDSDQKLKVEVDQTFSIPSDPGHIYKVLDIRPAQVIIRRIEDNHVWTLQKKSRS